LVQQFINNKNCPVLIEMTIASLSNAFAAGRQWVAGIERKKQPSTAAKFERLAAGLVVDYDKASRDEDQGH
jgi:hypothetical protein